MKLFLPLAPYANLDHEQTRAVCKFARHRTTKGIAWWRVGSGKSRIGIGTYIAKCLSATKRFPSVCVIVARPGAAFDWQDEVVRIGLDAHFTTKFTLSFQKPTFWYVSFASLASLQKEIDRSPFVDFVIVDELYLYSNPTSKRGRAMRRIADGRNVVGLAGTILTRNDNTQVWGQALSLGIERKLARNLTEFRSTYQRHFDVDFGNGGVRQHKNAPGWKEQVLEKLRDNVSIHFPPVLQRHVEKITAFPLTSLQRQLISDLEDHYFLEWKGHEFDLSYAFQVIFKIRGILNGWVELPDKTYESIPSNKLEGLLASLAELHEAGESCVVWCAFRNDVEIIRANCKFATLAMVGGMDFDLESFKSGKVRIVIATMGTGASVNHFRNVPYCKFYSLSNRLGLQQSHGRHTRRDSSLDTVHFQFFEGRESYETGLRKHLAQTDDEERSLIESWHQKIIQRTSTRSST